jgi:hypothetical protein
MLENRQIRALKVGTHWRIDPNEIDNLPERLLQEQKGLPTDAQQLLGTPKAKKTAPDEVGAENSDY